MTAAGLESVKLPKIEEPIKLHFHDIRGTTVTLLAEAGCTVPEIASITGHTLRRAEEILERYLARTIGLAENAIAKFENVVKTNSCKPGSKPLVRFRIK